MKNTPDNWVIIKFSGDDPHYRVLGGWSGGYLYGDSWRLNSGIVRVEENGDRLEFYGASGSCYSCHPDSYGLRMNNAGIWNQLQEKYPDQVELMDSDTNWLEVEWNIK